MERREGMRARGKGVFYDATRLAGSPLLADSRRRRQNPGRGTVDARAHLPLVWYTLLAGYSQVQMWVQALM